MQQSIANQFKIQIFYFILTNYKKFPSRTLKTENDNTSLDRSLETTQQFKKTKNKQKNQFKYLKSTNLKLMQIECEKFEKKNGFCFLFENPQNNC